MAPSTRRSFRVLAVEPAQHLVLYSLRHPWRGKPVDPADETALQAREAELRDGGVFLEFSWTFVLRPVAKAQTPAGDPRAQQCLAATGWRNRRSTDRARGRLRSHSMLYGIRLGVSQIRSPTSKFCNAGSMLSRLVIFAPRRFSTHV